MQLKGNDNATITFTITDLQGKILLTEENYNNQPTAFGKDLHHGVYVLRVLKGGDVAIQRLIKK